MAYTIYTEKLLEEVMEEGIRTRGGVEGDYLKRWRQDLREELDSNNGVSIFVADTLEELADKAGIDQAGLLSEVARYNAFCRKGEDEDFGKNPRDLKPLKMVPTMPSSGKWQLTAPSAACW